MALYRSLLKRPPLRIGLLYLLATSLWCALFITHFYKHKHLIRSFVAPNLLLIYLPLFFIALLSHFLLIAGSPRNVKLKRDAALLYSVQITLLFVAHTLSLTFDYSYSNPYFMQWGAPLFLFSTLLTLSIPIAHWLNGTVEGQGHRFFFLFILVPLPLFLLIRSTFFGYFNWLDINWIPLLELLPLLFLVPLFIVAIALLSPLVMEKLCLILVTPKSRNRAILLCSIIGTILILLIIFRLSHPAPPQLHQPLSML